MKKIILILISSCLLILSSCGGGDTDNKESDSNNTNNEDNQPVDNGDLDYAVNILKDPQGNSVIAIDSKSGEGVYMIHTGDEYSLDSLMGVLYKAPDGSTARITLDETGRPLQLETDDATYFYSDYTSRTVTVTKRSLDGSEELFTNLEIDPSLFASSRPSHEKIDRFDLAFMVGVVGTGLSVAFCVLPAASGVGALVTIGCANALLATVGTTIGSSNVGTGSTAVDLALGYFGDKGSLATGIIGTVSTLVGWETSSTVLQVQLAGLVMDSRTNGRIREKGEPAEAYVKINSQSVALSNGQYFSSKSLLGSGSYDISVEARGYIIDTYQLIVSGNRVAMLKKPRASYEEAEVIYDFTYQDISLPAIIYLPIKLDRAPKIAGRVVWPRRDENLNDQVEIISGGMITLYDSKRNKVAFFTTTYVSTASSDSHSSGGEYELYLPRVDGRFTLEYSGTHSDASIVIVDIEDGLYTNVYAPKTSHLEEQIISKNYDANETAYVDVPVTSRYDGHWDVTATPSIPSYTYSYFITDEEGVEQEVIETVPCEVFTATIELEGGAGPATIGDDTQNVIIGQKGEFEGVSWVVAWKGTIYGGGTYSEGDEECYGTFSTSR